LAGIVEAPDPVVDAGDFTALAWALRPIQELTKSRRFKKWIAENFFAACALQDASCWAKAFRPCLLGEALAATVNETASKLAARVVIIVFIEVLLLDNGVILSSLFPSIR
jgi:hypothetical protein